MHIAAQQGRLETVRALAKLGGKVNATNARGATPYHLAMEANCVEVSDLLLELSWMP
jgi:ankyrin repeat protein